MYGYAKIFAIRHAPVEEVLWLDCDVFPVRPLDSLFDDEEFQKTGAMYDYFLQRAFCDLHPILIDSPLT